MTIISVWCQNVATNSDSGINWMSVHSHPQGEIENKNYYVEQQRRKGVKEQARKTFTCSSHLLYHVHPLV